MMINMIIKCLLYLMDENSARGNMYHVTGLLAKRINSLYNGSSLYVGCTLVGGLK